jgi:phasin family protein
MSHVEAQLTYLQNLTARSIQGAEQIIALNIQTARASMEKSSAAVRQLLSAKDPRDLLALTTSTQEHFDSLMAYGRALAGIATSLPAPQAAPAAAPEEVEAAATETVAPVVLAAPETTPEPAAELAPPAPALPLKIKPKASAKPAAAKPAAAPFPSVATRAVKVSGTKPVDAAKPPPAQLDMLASKPKAAKKK